MPAADTVLLPICVALSLLGVIVTAVAWRRHRSGRAVQGVALVLAPIALYLTGLLRVVWDFVVAIVAWAGLLAFRPVVWIGLGLLGLAVVLLVVGGVIAGRQAGRRAVEKGAAKGVEPGAAKPVTSGRVPKGQPAAPKRETDAEMDEIEALLKSRGIE